MAYKIVVKQTAKDDMQEAYDYYEDLQLGLGEGFLEETKICFNEIQQAPHNNGYVDDQKIIRDVKIDRFPYVVVYEIIGEEVFVYHVHNTNKHPKRKLIRS